MKALRFVILIGALFASPLGSAIIIRHDVASARYEVAAASCPALFFLERRGARKVCVATLIHPRWALTAAHCVEETPIGATLANGVDYAVTVQNRSHHVDRVVVHPAYHAGGADLALLRFRELAGLPPPVPLERQAVTAGRIVELPGWGFFGRGTTGRQYDDATLRRAHNRIEEVGRYLRIRFDDPRQRDSGALELEGMPGLGDSGGPALLVAERGYRLAGIAVGEVEGEDFSEETQGRYGSVAVYENLFPHIGWIDNVIGEAAPVAGAVGCSNGQ